MPIHIIQVRDTLTIERQAQLLIEADTVDEAEELAIKRAKLGEIDFEEEQTDAEPYTARWLENPSDERFAQLMAASLCGLSPAELSELRKLQSHIGVTDNELERFTRQYPLGTKLTAARVDQ